MIILWLLQNFVHWSPILYTTKVLFAVNIVVIFNQYCFWYFLAEYIINRSRTFHTQCTVVEKMQIHFCSDKIEIWES